MKKIDPKKVEHYKSLQNALKTKMKQAVSERWDRKDGAERVNRVSSMSGHLIKRMMKKGVISRPTKSEHQKDIRSYSRDN